MYRNLPYKSSFHNKLYNSVYSSGGNSSYISSKPSVQQKVHKPSFPETPSSYVGGKQSHSADTPWKLVKVEEGEKIKYCLVRNNETGKINIPAPLPPSVPETTPYSVPETNLQTVIQKINTPAVVSGLNQKHVSYQFKGFVPEKSKIPNHAHLTVPYNTMSESYMISNKKKTNFSLNVFINHGVLIPIHKDCQYIFKNLNIVITGLPANSSSINVYADIEICYQAQSECKTVRLSWPIHLPETLKSHAQASINVSSSLNEILQSTGDENGNVCFMLVSLRLENSNKKFTYLEKSMQYIVQIDMLHDIKEDDTDKNSPSISYNKYPIMSNKTEEDTMSLSSLDELQHPFFFNDIKNDKNMNDYLSKSFFLN